MSNCNPNEVRKSRGIEEENKRYKEARGIEELEFKNLKSARAVRSSGKSSRSDNGSPKIEENLNKKVDTGA
ncbi:hypothetical protein KPH14_000783 [Odynerus spinipes]|uniref:Uncharacterized protein n=1 Tax=Odynerus spinipes TaxID=1348599 RepID=A0AAD9RFA9_9HYME|nr:hypothetical protein KPH14_000783 [Odynerus spinipes]